MPDGKRIILLSDGTGNSASQVWKSNVWRVFESLDLRGSTRSPSMTMGLAHPRLSRLPF